MTDLQTILKGINWIGNISASLGSGSTLEEIDGATKRIAIWSKQIENADKGNAALCFVREMQHAIHHGGALIGICLYKPSAASSRTLVESCIYYTYFRTHIEELSTLVSNDRYFVSKSEIVEYHKVHTVDFKQREQSLNLVDRLERWYSRVSAVVHGQIPGTWNTNNELSQTSFSLEVQQQALTTLLEGVSIVNDLLLCTVARVLWMNFAPEAKSFLLKGMPASKRDALGLDMK